MQRYFLPSLLAVIFMFSCSSDDNTNTSSQEDLIIGSWRPIKEVQVCENGNEESLTLDACSQTNILIFQSDGNFS